MRGTKELLNAMHDAFQALVAVHDKARRIHRDISAGYLIDSSKVQEDEQATDKYIVGTRMFLSQRLEARSQRRQMLQEDMEALLYVVAYCGLHRLQHPAHSQMMKPGKGKLDIKEKQTYLPNFNVDLKDLLSRSMDLNHPRRPSEATQWDTPEPWNDYWKEFLGHKLPEDNGFASRIDPSQQAEGAATPRADWRPTDDGQTNGVPANGRPVKRLKRAAG
ncbi:hypothetical protein BKA93DRAFT_752499 [Sparassis latifolia]